MNDGINGETTGDGKQDAYDRAMIQLVITNFDPGEIPAMMQRAYLGDDVMPDWESSTPAIPEPERRSALAPPARLPCTDELPAQPKQAAILIPVRHHADRIPAWRRTLIQVLAAGIARLA